MMTIIGPAMRAFGLDPARAGEAELAPDVTGYLEFHIEQGPVLEHLNLPLGVVEAIAGQSRVLVQFEGKANHAGTTPMALRRDALACAAEWITAVERHAMQTAGLVATVGSLEVEPGATNVVPGAVLASLDVRHADDPVRRSAVQRLIGAAGEIASRRGVDLSFDTRLDEAAVTMDRALTDHLQRAVASAGYPVHNLVSGAGHDAMIMAQRVPVAMLFLRSPGGISHHPDEAVLVEDVEAALAAGSYFLETSGASACTTS
jgi:allantoate deiminase